MKITDYELIDHGIEWSDYFQGCGTAFTNYNHVVTGIGDNPAEAISDALEMITECDDLDEFEKRILTDNGWGGFPEIPSVMERFPSDEGEDFPNYHVSIRYNLENKS